ncbi:MAG: hypothetical protein DQL93_0215 (endogenous virus) [Lactobacillus phage ViSo-2018b]|nr:MAG: hypothetical protein DQL93_0215 [Lactobacillus phage ViSo-2018b]
MDTKQLDLDDRLADFFDKETGAGSCWATCQKMGRSAFFQDPGSAPTSAPYFNGDQPMSMQYEVLCSTQDYLTARQLLSPIANSISKISGGSVKRCSPRTGHSLATMLRSLDSL